LIGGDLVGDGVRGVRKLAIDEAGEVDRLDYD